MNSEKSDTKEQDSKAQTPEMDAKAEQEKLKNKELLGIFDAYDDLKAFVNSVKKFEGDDFVKEVMNFLDELI